MHRDRQHFAVGVQGVPKLLHERAVGCAKLGRQRFIVDVDAVVIVLAHLVHDRLDMACAEPFVAQQR